ncbi:MAG: hypothetical protein QM564_06650 [Bergeyella sp.]
MLKSGFKSDTVYLYSENKDKLLRVLTDTQQKFQAFQSILEYLEADVFLIEDNYVDKDYLEDYTSFYARCHYPYHRFCKRIHFFKKKGNFFLTDDLLKKLFYKRLTQKAKENIQQSYIGFIVLKPSKNDNFIVGRTCLAHYNEDSKRNRKYYATREYSANLYGIPLTVKSMAFQEQDEAVAACASIALWSAFNITGKKYQHRIPSPSEVTNLALSETSYQNGFPNEGLTAEQMAVAVSKIRLKPLILRPIGDRHLKAQIYAYLRAGIPIICGISLYDKYKKPQKGSFISQTKSFHAVTINGFSFEDGVSDIAFSDRLKLVSSRMTKFFVHDDQLCPFARMSFETKYSQVNSKLIKLISTSWSSQNGRLNKSLQTKLEDNKIAKVDSLIIPLYHKIRIAYTDILENVQKFATEMDEFLRSFYEKINHTYIPYEWDIFLSEVNDLKRDILEQPQLEHKETILKKGFAKYLWRAQAVYIEKKEEIKDITITEGINDTDTIEFEYNKNILFELVFDATDSKKKGLIKELIFYDKDISTIYYSFTNIKKQNNIL